jgi:hypothetical protein
LIRDTIATKAAAQQGFDIGLKARQRLDRFLSLATL